MLFRSPILLILSVFYSFNSNLGKIIGLAWDCGAVTTGAVTVPLVLALGIGVSRAASKGKGSSSGFGIVLLASAFPILAVLVLGVIINLKSPVSTTESAFFASDNRKNALMLFDSEERLLQHAFTHGTEEGRRAFYNDENTYTQAIFSLKDNPNTRQTLLGSLTLENWVINKASENERKSLSDMKMTEEKVVSASFSNTIKEESVAGARAVIPLSLLLLIVLLAFLREKLRYKDEVALGIIFTLVGMTLLTSGIKLGLASLGGEVGAQLPRAFASEDKYIDRVLINNFDKELLYSTIASDGTQKIYFNYAEGEIGRASCRERV